MAKIKIVSNPYNREISFLSYKEQTGLWEDVRDNNANSRLREDESVKGFLPFKIKEIIDIIIDEYNIGTEAVEIFFEGTQDEYAEVKTVCMDEKVKDKIVLTRTSEILENARFILKDIKEIFDKVHPIVEKIVRDDISVKKNLNKVSDALKDIIPICVFGNYSAGKSTFINALIGREILPSGGDPITAKIYKIECSKHSDRARIKFTYEGEVIELSFEGNVYRVINGNMENELVQELNKIISECKNEMFTMVKYALEIINGFEKKDKSSIAISNVIELEVPFSPNGILRQSYNNFVIFDTPGSNSASNIEHSKVLAEALEGFSNGIPVWISQYETIDSEDNANLCDKIFDIKALDKRFTMIIMNKADGSELEENGFSKEQVKEILEYNAVEKMYASGIYFVSSIMGLGAKNNGELIDKHYRKTYRSQQEMYADQEDIDYASLYKYNIMPEQIKNKAMEYSSQCTNLIYANSGFYCVEMEIENFANNHSAYNKCQMVYMFLNDVIDETNRRIISKTETLKKTRDIRRNELESAKTKLIDNLASDSQMKEVEFDKASKVYIKNYVEENLNYLFNAEKLDKLDIDIRIQNSEANHISEQKNDFEESKNMILTHLKENGQNIFKGKVIDSIKDMKEAFDRDCKEMQESKQVMNFAEREVDKATSDKLMEIVIEEYKKNIVESKDSISMVLRELWFANAQKLRTALIEIITDSEALSVSQRDEISNIIINYQPLEFNDDAENIFIKKRYLRGNVLGLKLNDSEKLNTKRLTMSYNEKIDKNINEIASVINASYFSGFKTWEQNLASIIEKNITEYNPKLRGMAEMIREETEKITELEDDQQTIISSLNAIKELMSWKVLQ